MSSRPRSGPFATIKTMKADDLLGSQQQLEATTNPFAKGSLFITLFTLIAFGVIEFFSDNPRTLVGAATFGFMMESMALLFGVFSLRHDNVRANKDLALTAIIASIMGAVIIFGFILGDLTPIWIID